jgi:hypothetical protein
MDCKSNYRIKIVTDGLKAQNTFIYMDGVKIPYLQEFEINVSSCDILVPVQMTVLPLPIDEVIFEDSDTEAEERIAKFQNKLEIYTDGHSTNTMIYLNGTIIGCINSFRLYANANQEDIELEMTQWLINKKEELFAEGKSLVQPVTLKDFISYKE